MNTAQIIRQSLGDCDMIKQDSTTDPFVTQAELLAWANAGKEKMEKALRAAHADYGLLILQSDDTDYTWGHSTFDVSTLALASTTKYYTLPPDCQTLKRIRALTDGYTDLRFLHADLSSEDFRDIEEDTTDGDGDILFDIVGERTLYIPNPPSNACDIEISYIARSLPLQLYSTGTVSIDNGSAAVTGSGTAWQTDQLFHNLELIVSADGTAPKVASATTGGTWVDPSSQYYPISTITGDGTATLQAVWPVASIAGKGHMLATVPLVPSEHHHALVHYVSHRILLKAGSPRHKDFLDLYERDLKEIRPDVQLRQVQDPAVVEDLSWS